MSGLSSAVGKTPICAVCRSRVRSSSTVRSRLVLFATWKFSLSG